MKITNATTSNNYIKGLEKKFKLSCSKEILAFEDHSVATVASPKFNFFRILEHCAQLILVAERVHEIQFSGAQNQPIKGLKAS